MTCPACQKRQTDGSPTHRIAFIEIDVCAPCFAKLHRPTRLDGCVAAAPLIYICNGAAQEVASRLKTLLQQVMDVCQEGPR